MEYYIILIADFGSKMPKLHRLVIWNALWADSMDLDQKIESKPLCINLSSFIINQEVCTLSIDKSAQRAIVDKNVGDCTFMLSAKMPSSLEHYFQRLESRQ